MAYQRNLAEMDWTEQGHGERFHFHKKTLTPYDQPYLPKFGVTVYRLQVGKRSFPFHEHLANDEGILVTKGAGTLRYGDEEVPLGEGDYIHLPAASGKAHQMINTSAAELEYLCFSSVIQPEVVVYPDSNKLGAYSRTLSPDGSGPQRQAFILRNDPVEYFAGEDPGVEPGT